MSNVVIKKSSIQFRNPHIGKPSRAVEDHYFGRNVTVDIDGEERLFRLKPDEIAFDVTEDDMVMVLEQKIHEEQLEENEE